VPARLRVNVGQEFKQCRVESVGQPPSLGDAYLALAALNEPDLRSVQAAAFSQLLLRQAAGGAEAPHAEAERDYASLIRVVRILRKHCMTVLWDQVSVDYASVAVPCDPDDTQRYP
jgi:hypothetical protein